MAIKKSHLRDLVNWCLDKADWYSDSALELILGTIAQESRGGYYLLQLGNGPAKGIIQMEPNTELDIWKNYLMYKPGLQTTLKRLSGVDGPDDMHLEGNLIYQILMCRLHYMRVTSALPNANDLEDLAAYWKLYYNTPAGAGTTKEFIENYKKYVL